MTDKEVMQMALDALEQITPDWRTPIDKHEQLNNSIEALCARLAQPEQEPVAWMYPDDADKMRSSETFCTVFSVQVGNASRCVSDVPLYTTSPQREWVGLTGEELQEIYQGGGTVHFKLAMAEAKLKDKNT